METQFMVKKKTEVPPELLSKEFLKQFKTEEDVSKFLKDFHSQVLEQMLQGEMDAHLGYEKNDVAGNNTGNSRNGSFPKTIQTEHGESTIQIPRDRNGEYDPIIVPKHQSRGLSIEKLVISCSSLGPQGLPPLSSFLCLKGLRASCNGLQTSNCFFQGPSLRPESVPAFLYSVSALYSSQHRTF